MIFLHPNLYIRHARCLFKRFILSKTVILHTQYRKNAQFHFHKILSSCMINVNIHEMTEKS